MAFTKHKHPDGWRIRWNGKDTRFLIIKGDPPKYREGQQYYLVGDGDLDAFMFDALGVGAIMEKLETIAGEMGVT